jgi:glycerol-3-phosphate dehydrogenase
VALVERDDFAAGTSSRSTKLIHGGFRYLAQAFQAKLPPNSILDIILNLRYRHEYMKILNADLYERAYMIESAGFMTRPLPIMVPMYRWWEVCSPPLRLT